MAVQFSDTTQKKFDEILTHYPNKRAALLPTFWLAQGEFGYLSPEVMEYIAQLLGLSPAYVGAVASFYTMYNKAPVGKFHVQVCTNLSCTLMGAEDIGQFRPMRFHCESVIRSRSSASAPTVMGSPVQSPCVNDRVGYKTSGDPNERAHPDVL